MSKKVKNLETEMNDFHKPYDSNVSRKILSDWIVLGEEEGEKIMKENQKPRNEVQVRIDDTSFDSSVCFYCDEHMDLTDLECNHKICTICVNNLLEINMEGPKSEPLKCRCNKIIKSTIFQNMVCEETYKNYLLRYWTKAKATYYYKDIDCDLCGERHKGNISCNEHYLSTNPKQVELCTNCKKSDAEDILNCKHLFCKPCLIGHLRSIMDNDPFTEQFACITCKAPIFKQIVYRIFDSEKNYNRYKEVSVGEFFSPNIYCEICYGEYKASNVITLECEHKFCKVCIGKYFESMIRSSDVVNIKCPNGCKDEISPYLIESNVSEQLFNTLKEVALRLYKPTEESLIMKWCRDCSYGELIEINQKEFHCPNCKSSYCPQCNTKHAIFSKCANLRKTMKTFEIKKHLDDVYLQEYLKDAMYCPNCNEAIIKADGCNFLKCPMPGCVEVYFCSICLKRLQKEDHFSHYRTTGPFGLRCNTVDRLD